jgi:SPP1 family predicted phage head-tail adaptor
MKPGELKHSIIIQAPTQTVDTSGAPTETWTNLVTARAKRMATGGGEFWAAQKMNENTQAVYTIRYYPNLSTKMRLVHGSDNYDILSIVPAIDERYINISVRLVE